jgi:2-phosphoglycerate kinase
MSKEPGATPATSRHVVIDDKNYELPYSKGLMASRITVTGLTPARAFHVAEVVESRLHDRRQPRITVAELNHVVLEVLTEEVGQRYAASFAKWQLVAQLDVPLVVLVGGATGVGKSTIATMLASRLGMTRVIPTDAIREVMRAMLTEALMPTLHTSSFDAARLLRHPLPRGADSTVIGFREQAAAVAVGIEALIARAADEGTDVIVEGAHLVPGFIDEARFKGRAVVVPIVVTVDDEERHRSHFRIRAHDVRHRPSNRYLDAFDNIRKQQRYLKSMALEHGIPIIPSYNLDAALSQVIDLVVNQAVEAIPKQIPEPADEPVPDQSPLAGGSERGAR